LQIDKLDLPVLPLAAADPLPGEPVTAFGNRLGAGGPLLSAGTITGLHRQAEVPFTFRKADRAPLAEVEDPHGEHALTAAEAAALTPNNSAWVEEWLIFKDVYLTDTMGGFNFMGGP